ncbi:MAG TPA: class I SAM-dependent methyltransferase [Aggregatilineaceae bacterium]|nr:class I SAM-dependent methyltransferase [Aggregatilineaceae bacterium]
MSRLSRLAREENAYGFRKRFTFISSLIEQHRPDHVLDVGCGTGEFLTIPLAERFPEVRFVGIDSDAVSIIHAREQNHLPNLSFPDTPPAGECFDLVIASEVLEHVDAPDQFLAELRGYLSDHGRIVITTPNGYGPFEWASLLETMVMVARRSLVPGERRRQAPEIEARDTLAISPHVNFFTRGDLRRLFEGAGLRVVEARSRTFLCGRGFDTLVRRVRLIEWNARIADRLPAWMNSDWMFVLGQGGTAHPQPYRRRLDARLRRALNAKRWGTDG